MSPGKVLYNLRKSRNMTQAQLAKALNGEVAQSSIAFYENGKRNMSLEVMKLFANYFDVPVSRFLSEEKLATDDERIVTMVDLMHQSQEYRTLFDMSRKVSADDLRSINNIFRSIVKERESDADE